MLLLFIPFAPCVPGHNDGELNQPDDNCENFHFEMVRAFRSYLTESPVETLNWSGVYLCSVCSPCAVCARCTEYYSNFHFGISEFWIWLIKTEPTECFPCKWAEHIQFASERACVCVFRRRLRMRAHALSRLEWLGAAFLPPACSPLFISSHIVCCLCFGFGCVASVVRRPAAWPAPAAAVASIKCMQINTF